MKYSCDKKNIDELAVFGGRSLFDEVRPIGQLAVPSFSQYWTSLEPIIARGSFEGGESVERLERALARFHDVDHCITVTNACLGLIFVMQLLFGEKRGSVIVPAFTYVGIPHLVRWAGHEPHYCDVEPLRHGLDPSSVAKAIDRSTMGILAVCSVTGTSAIDELSAVARDSGIPLVLDSVSALGATYGGRRLGGFGQAEVFSLHATKLLAGFEGGYVTTNNSQLAAGLRHLRDDVSATASLNEAHAAMALLALQALPQTIERNRERYETYRRSLANIPGMRLLEYVDEARESYTYQMAFAEFGSEWPLSRSQTIAIMRAEGAGVMAYYDPPLHRSIYAPHGITPGPMPIAEYLAQRFMYLPVGERTSVEDIERIGGLICFLHDRATVILDRLKRLGIP